MYLGKGLSDSLNLSFNINVRDSRLNLFSMQKSIWMMIGSGIHDNSKVDTNERRFRSLLPSCLSQPGEALIEIDGSDINEDKCCRDQKTVQMPMGLVESYQSKGTQSQIALLSKAEFDGKVKDDHAYGAIKRKNASSNQDDTMNKIGAGNKSNSIMKERTKIPDLESSTDRFETGKTEKFVTRIL
jgi:hypothetical protein